MYGRGRGHENGAYGRGGRGGRGPGGRGRGGRIAPGSRPVTEGDRISIAEQLENFQHSEDTEYKFPPGLSNHDRAVVHAECKKYGFNSKSYGKGNARAVTVFKTQKRRQDLSAIRLSLSSEAQRALLQHVERFPPSGPDGVVGEPGATRASETGREGKQKAKHAKPRGPASSSAAMSPEEVARRVASWKAAVSAPAAAAMQAQRAALPMAAHRQELLDAVAAHQVVLVSGETGCGKTTQVPQYLLEDAWAAGRGCHVLCTQPRRISAISCSERIASERGEAPGVNVGYNIRLESCGGRDTSLLFATNGVLLRMLSSGPRALDHVTHLVMDEIHERDRFADFTLILIRDLLPANPNLRVILMSATLHTELFSGYFGGCPVVRVPGFTYPVEDFYLEDVLRFVQYQVPQEHKHALGGRKQTSSAARVAATQAAIEVAFKEDTDEAFDHLMNMLGLGMESQEDVSLPLLNVQHEATGASALMVTAGRGRVDAMRLLLSHGADTALKSRDGSTAVGWARMFGRGDLALELEAHLEQAATAAAIGDTALAVAHYQSETDMDEVDVDLIVRLLMYVCGEPPYAPSSQGQEGQPGAVLVFLPGWDEISRLKETLENHHAFRRTHNGYQILPLHSMVAPAEQRRVFQRPPRGVRKLVLATNIAETAITIDDVVVVINAGRLREKGYDPFTGVSTLQSAWISQASERQRRGRAGRCQPGTAFHLYTRTRSNALAEFQAPELRRSPLEELALQIKLLEGSGQRLMIGEFLSKAIDPPVPQATKAARQLLEDIGALDSEERLTALGRHLAAIPLPPALGKLLLYGVMFDCLDPILTLACFKAYREPWVLPTAFDAKAAAWKLRCQMSDAEGGASDHMACLHAFQGYRDARRRGGERSFCVQNFISPSTMAMVYGMRGQLSSELQRLGFIQGVGEASAASSNLGLVRSVLAAGLYPMLARMLPATSAKAMVLTRRGEKVRIHPSSVNAKLGSEGHRSDDRNGDQPPENTVLVIDELTRGDASMYVKSCSVAPGLAFLLVAASLEPVEPEDSEDDDDDPMDGGSSRPRRPQDAKLVMDAWLPFRVSHRLVDPLVVLRSRLSAAFQATVEDARVRLAPHHADALRTASVVLASQRVGSKPFRDRGRGARPAALAVPRAVHVPLALPRHPQRHEDSRPPYEVPRGQQNEGGPRSRRQPRGPRPAQPNTPGAGRGGGRSPLPHTSHSPATPV